MRSVLLGQCIGFATLMTLGAASVHPLESPNAKNLPSMCLGGCTLATS